jgi:hypothetical protein
MIGILLAGGSAVRLPNKILLPIYDGDGNIIPMFLSGFYYLLNQGADRVVVLDQPNSLLEDVMAGLVLCKCERIVDDHAGLLNALLMVKNMYPEEQSFLVCCADNVYDETEKLPDLPRFAVVRRAPPELDELDWYDADMPETTHGTHRWKSRDVLRCDAPALTTPWKLSRSDIPNLPVSDECTLLKFFNSRRLPGVELPLGQWSDLGTKASYKAYWKAKLQA